MHREATQFAVAAANQNEVRNPLCSDLSRPRRTESLHSALSSDKMRSVQMSSGGSMLGSGAQPPPNLAQAPSNFVQGNLGHSSSATG